MSLVKERSTETDWKSSHKKSIGFTLATYMFCGTFIGLGAMAFLFYQALEKQAAAAIQSHVTTKVGQIEKSLAEVEQTAISFSAAVQTLQQKGVQNPEIYQELLFSFFKQRPEATLGLGFGQTPYGILSGRQWYYPSYSLNQGAPDQVGQLLPPPYEEIRFSELFKEDNYPEQNYYKTAVKLKEAIWYESYQRYGVTTTTYAHPIFNSANQLIGITTLDINEKAIADQVEEPVLNGQGYYAILSAQGKVVVYPPDTQKAKELTNYKDIPQLAALWPKLEKDGTGLVQLNGTYWAYQPIAGTNWMMLAAVPKSAVLAPILMMLVSGVLVAGLVLVFVVVVFVRQLNRRLRPILQECRQLTENVIPLQLQNLGTFRSEENKKNLNQENLDEIEILAISFRELMGQLRESFQALVETNNLMKTTDKELEIRVEESTAELRQAKNVAEQEKQILQRRVLEFLQESDAMSKQNLTLRATVQSDEIGIIADHYNSLLRYWQAMMRQIQDNLNQIVMSANENIFAMPGLYQEVIQQSTQIPIVLEQVEQLSQAISLLMLKAQQVENHLYQVSASAEVDEAIEVILQTISSQTQTISSVLKTMKNLAATARKSSTEVDLISTKFEELRSIAQKLQTEISQFKVD